MICATRPSFQPDEVSLFHSVHWSVCASSANAGLATLKTRLTAIILFAVFLIQGVLDSRLIGQASGGS